MSKEKRLGRGLAALLGEPMEQSDDRAAAEAGVRLHEAADAGSFPASVEAAVGELVLIDVQAIRANPYQPRKEFDSAEIDSLAESLKAHDMLQPLLVRQVGDAFQLISGERRLRAAAKAGWTKVPCRIRSVDDREMAELAIVENLQRKDLNAIEKAQSFQRYLQEHDAKQEELAERLKIDRSSVSNLLRLLELPAEVQSAVSRGELTSSHARALLPLGEEQEQVEFCRTIIQSGMSVRDTELMVQTKIEVDDAFSPSDTPSGGRIKRTRNEHIASLEKDLKLALGTKIEIKANTRGRGKLLVHFKSNEEFERIYDLLLGAGGAEITSKAG